MRGEQPPTLDNNLEQKIELIENSPLDIEDKLDLALLLLSEEKKGVYIGTRSNNYKSPEERQEIINEFTKLLKNIVELLPSLGLHYKVVHELINENQEISFSVVAVKDQNMLEELAKYAENGDEKNIGILLGYPQTAVDAYHTDQQFSFRKELPPDEIARLRAEGVASFCRFLLSREHWEEELEFVRQQQRLVRDKAPKLYEEVVRTLK